MVFQNMNKDKKIIVEAHRGASGYEKDNTFESFEKAVSLKADAIELDIRKTKDGKIVVFHDLIFKEKSINDYTYDELIIKSKEDGFIVPLLVDVLIKFKGRILLDIEIKEEGYEQEIIDLILSILTINEFYIRSFSESTIKKVKEINKDIYAILLIGAEFPKYGIFSRFGEIFPKAKIKRSNCDAVSPHYRLLLFGFVKRMHKKNIKVYVWTVNNEETMKKVYAKKVDGIVTNYPDIAMKLLNK